MTLALAFLIQSGAAAQAQATEVSSKPGDVTAVTTPSDRETPISLQHSVAPLERVATLRVASVDVAAATAEDIERESSGQPPRFAVERPVDVNPRTDGTWETLDSGLSVWRLRVSALGAHSLNFGFVRYQLPESGRLLVYSVDLSRRLRSFSAADNETHGQLWTPPIEAEEVVLEIVIPTSEVASVDVQLGSVNVGYRSFGEVAASPSGSCNVDVSCAEGQAWQNQIRTVGLISVAGVKLCSGVMLNNTAEDFRPYFLTADHCDVTSQNAASVVVFWNYQNSTCRTPSTPESGFTGDGDKDQFQTGAFLRAAWSPIDMSLLELDDAPDTEWGVNFAGWDHSETDPTSAVCIHHPRGGEKRISFEQESAYTTSYLGLVSPGDGTHLRVTDWDLGTTEPGSSGAPLFDPAHRVVGILHGGYAQCGNDDSDWFTRFAVAWDLGGTAATRLRDWLDPLGTGADTLDLISSHTVHVTPARGTSHMGRVGGPFSNPEVVYTLRNPTGDSTSYQVFTDRGLLLLNGATTPLQGVLPADGGTTEIVVRLPDSITGFGIGAYDDTLRVVDLTHGLTQSRRHTIEVGLTRFATAPSEGFFWGGPVGGPFNGSALYTVRNEQPTPVSVRISANVPWISLSGAPGPLTIDLPSQEFFDGVAVGFSDAALGLTEGSHSGLVTFQNLSGGAGDTVREITLEVGRIVYASLDSPLAVPDQTTITSFVDIPQDFCIADLDLDLELRHSYVSDLVVELTSPSGTIVRLHNRTGASNDDLVLTYDDDGKGVAPDGPGNLADFDSESTAGRWRLSVADRASGDTGVLDSWRIRVGPEVANCPIPSLIYQWNFDTDPHWTTQGLWAFGVPGGFGSYNGDPGAGNTGQTVYGYNLQGDYQNGLASAQYLTTTAIDCSELTGTRLRFYRWLGVERSQYDKASIQVSRDGVTWTTVWSHTDPGSIEDSEWAYQTFNISDLADGQPSVFIRWGMGPTDSTTSYPGWNIDDVQIWGLAPFDDCNRNGLPDGNDLQTGRSKDCNGNDLPDECDIEGGGSGDCNQDGIPDECDCRPLRAILPEPGGTMKSRYVSFRPPNVACPIALRIRVQPSTAFAELAGDSYWVGAPIRVNETGAPGGFFMVAPLQCQPFVTDWSAIPLLHVYGAAIVPNTEYEVQAIRAGCLAGAAPTSGDGYSPPLFVMTSKWGDVIAPFGGLLQPAFTDVAALVDRFQSVASAPIRPRLQLRPEVPNPTSPINFLDIAAELDAFKGVPYPFAIPTGCP